MPRRVRRSLTAAIVVLAGACSTSSAGPDVERARDAPPTSDVVPEVPAEAGTTTNTTPPPSPEDVEPGSPGKVRAAAWTTAPYHGLGAWLDAFDWSVTFAGGLDKVVGVEAIDDMAAQGVQTLYLQVSRWNSPTDILEPELLQPIIDRAHAHGISVIAWYLPTLIDLETDFRRVMAAAALDVDGFALDIEARDVEDIAERNARLLTLSRRLDDALGDRALGAIVLEPVIMEDVNPNYWPSYPWAELAPHFDVWLPMGYWTNRKGEWRVAHTYTSTNIARIRERIGQPDALIHAIGGIGDKTSVEDLHGMVAAATEHGAIGGSLYDYATTKPEFWDVLRQFRR